MLNHMNLVRNYLIFPLGTVATETELAAWALMFLKSLNERTGVRKGQRLGREAE